MIETLGINYGSVVQMRQEYLKSRFQLLEYEVEIEITQFPTAYEMANILKNNDEQNSILDSL